MQTVNENMENCSTPTKNTISFRGFLTQHQSPHCKTPLSRPAKIKNPFEKHLQEHLGKNFSSPSLFVVKQPAENQGFKWTIDELSILKPAEIDEDAGNQQFDTSEGHCDMITQSRIDNYFSMKEILPSPMQPCIPTPLISNFHDQDDDECDSTSVIQIRDSSSQTVLSLPPILPPEVEKVLQPYFNFTQDQQQEQDTHDNLSDRRALYKQLFEAVEIQHVESCDEPRPAIEVHKFISPMINSPATCGKSRVYIRTFGTPGNLDTMNLCDVSPICSKAFPIMKRQESSQHMSFDDSFNVPNTSISEKANNSQEMDSFHSNSSANWDLEYKQVSSERPNEMPVEGMDLSQNNTPKQRPYLSFRKKLSDSFGNDGGSEDDEYAMQVLAQNSQSGAESGYQTGTTNPDFSNLLKSISPTEENVTMWKSMNVVSSTPTKQKK